MEKFKTEDFFNAIAKVGTNKSFTKLATSYKTAGQAMDGLKETLGVKLVPTFNKASDVAISGIAKVIGRLDKVDPDVAGKESRICGIGCISVLESIFEMQLPKPEKQSLNRSVGCWKIFWWTGAEERAVSIHLQVW